jgi:SAM-dependent methyltransferase
MTGEHWESVYTTKGDADVSWTQAEPRLSLSLIGEVCPVGTVIDVGAGSSVLVDRLLDRAYSVAVLDISGAALARSQSRLGARAKEVRWIVADVTTVLDVGRYDVWHDRAVFHFLAAPGQRSAYRDLMVRTVPTGGHVIIATFAPEGPKQCSGLPVCRYDGPALAAELGPQFRLIRSLPETHLTPTGKPQSFQYSVFRRVSE